MPYEFPPHAFFSLTHTIYSNDIRCTLEYSETQGAESEWVVLPGIDLIWKHFGLAAQHFPFPKQYSFLRFNHNFFKRHKEPLKFWSITHLGFKNKRAIQIAKKSNEIWTLMWHTDLPDTPSYRFSAPTVDELFKFANPSEIKLRTLKDNQLLELPDMLWDAKPQSTD
jgi:hypothetical protein